MMAKNRSCAAFVAALFGSACATSGGASPPTLDHEANVGAPVFRPLLVVPLPPPHDGTARPGRVVEAMQARATPLGDVLRTLFKDSDLNLVIDPASAALECTFDVKRSTVEEVFEALLAGHDLAYQWDGSFLRVVDRVQETITIDLMEATSSEGGEGDSGSSGGSSSGSGGGAVGFWEDIATNLPQVLGEDATFVINRAASAIHVRSRPSGVRRLREIVGATVGRANKQVSLEARIMEVRLDNEHSLGINWSLLPGLFNSNKTGLAGSGSVASQTAASGGTALTFGVLDGGDFSVVVDALQSQGQVRVLSSPRVSTLNNQVATIAVTDQIPYITREVITDQGVARTEFNVEFVESGVELEVRPLIGDDGLLSVAITPSVREQIGTAVTPDGIVSVPIVSRRQATTTVRVADGQAIALGGLRSTRKSEVREGVPFLMDVPWLGQAFSKTVQERSEVELMIVLVPRVLDDTWIGEELRRGSHRLVQLRRGFQWNSIRLDGERGEDWSGGSLQGTAQTVQRSDLRTPPTSVAPTAVFGSGTMTRAGLAGHAMEHAEEEIARGNPREALVEIERALQLDPTLREALIAGGVLLQRRGEQARARELLDRALQLAADDIVALTARGALEIDAGSPLAARRYLELAHHHGKSTLTAANLGAALLVLGEDRAARDLLRGAADPAAPPELHANLAYAELATGDTVRARAGLRQALIAGGDVRNPRLVALERLIADAEAKLTARP